MESQEILYACEASISGATAVTMRTPKEAATCFAREYWAEPRKLKNWKEDGTFEMVGGVRRYKVQLRRGDRFTRPDTYVIQVA